MIDCARDADPNGLVPAPEQLQQLAAGTFGAPFDLLGPHRRGDGWVVRVVAPTAAGVEVADARGRVLGSAGVDERVPGLFEIALEQAPGDYRLRVFWPRRTQLTIDPYALPSLLGQDELEAFAAGLVRHPARVLGACPMHHGAIHGTRFAVWAPRAHRASVVGDFNAWDGRRHPMRRHAESGVWELFVPDVGAGAAYKFELLDDQRRLLPLKADPFARRTELVPGTASVVAANGPFSWHDGHWMQRRARAQPIAEPLSIYEVHALSWMHRAEGGTLGWDELADRLIPHVQQLGFTHIELLPLAEFPFDGSWGYQPTGLYAPTARLGAPAAFARFVDSCHVAGIGVIVDWVGAHFPDDPHGLGTFDGAPLFEYADPREGFHPDWHTLIYDLTRPQVRNFLIGSALEWLEHFHVDALRVDAVASMIWRNFGREAGQWLPNVEGGRENLEAVAFLRELNRAVHEHVPGAMVIAEESTAWPGVTAAVDAQGLGFDFKWNMGWMHDTLSHLARDPVHRRHHHRELTFGMLYAWSEHFILPLSHDEVVHGRGSLLSRMPGDRTQRFAHLRALLGLMWAWPGKKLLFMGGEFGQADEWNHRRALDWALLDQPAHRGVQHLVGDLNRLLQEEPALHREDLRERAFSWVVADDAEQSVLAWLRAGDDGATPVLAVSNLTPVARHDYRIGVPVTGPWRELCNTDSGYYCGGNHGNGGAVIAEPEPSHGYDHSLRLLLPPLATLLLRPEQDQA